MIVRHLHTVYELLAVSTQPTVETSLLRELVSGQGRYPSRRTWECRLKALPATLPAQIGCLDCHLVGLIEPWSNGGRQWPLIVPSCELEGDNGIRSIASKGLFSIRLSTSRHMDQVGLARLKMHLVCTVAAVWLPLAALLTPANLPDSNLALELLRKLPAEVRFVLGDRHYNRDELHALCVQDGRCLVTTKYGRYPHTDDGVEVCRTFHKLRSVAIENFHEHFKSIFDGYGQVPTKGLLATQRFALGVIFVYQLALLYRFENGLELCVGLKASLKVGLMIYDQASSKQAYIRFTHPGTYLLHHIHF